jgi:hypothetical protein
LITLIMVVKDCASIYIDLFYRPFDHIVLIERW